MPARLTPARLLFAVPFIVLALAAGAPASASAAASITDLRVQGVQLVDGAGVPVRIAGVNRSGSEYACAQGWGMFDGPTDDASIAAIASWGANAVRVPLNESCWLGINGVASAYAGSNYRQAVRAFVDRLHAHGLAVILDLHWAAPGGKRALGQLQAPDADHAPAFWRSVASEYRDVPAIAFDVFNEPHDISWSCWRDGCTTSAGWQAAGMQELVDAVRGTGAKQPVIVEGLAWGGDLSGWEQYRPFDSARQLAAGWHIYNFSGCHTTSCWDATVAPAARQVPVVATEFGEDDCAGGFLDTLLPWADAHGVGYAGWSWNTASCGSGPALITDYAGSPTPYGKAYKSHLDALGDSRPLDGDARHDFEDGSTQGWSVRWGDTLQAGNATGTAWSGSHGLALDVTGAGWPAVGTGSGLGSVGAGTVVRYRVWAPKGVAAGVSPMLFDGGWRAVVLPEQPLEAGWNTVTFTIPAGTDMVRILGLQVGNGGGWRGRLVLDDVTWQPVRFDFEDGTAQGWGVSWGSTVSVAPESGTAFTGGGGLALDVSGSGYPAVGTGAASLGLHAGSTVTYRVWAPEGVAAGVAPMLFDQDWRVAVLDDERLSPGWNTIRFTLPPAVGTPQVIGLQVNDGSGWAGRLVLDAVAL